MSEFSYAGTTCRVMQGNLGDVLADDHVHTFDHLTAVVVGEAYISVRAPDGLISEGIYLAGTMVPVPAGHHHRVEARADGTKVWCVFACRDADGNLTGEYVGPVPAYFV